MNVAFGAAGALVLLSSLLPAASLRYWISPCSRPETECRSDDAELAQWAMEAWQRESAGALILTKTDNQMHAQIRFYWASRHEQLYGETKPIVVDGLRGGEIHVLPSVVPASERDRLLRDAIVYLTCVHESGHALGLEHTANFADIMYSFQYGGDIGEYFGRYRRELAGRGDIHRRSGISDTDRRQLAVLYAKLKSGH
ncbi:MAG TPA: matrixin family metalloprotease [Bryobacteraceae bacterium]|nr:matrixin family metalloprotease [Bryobacteraceae bacterium]